MFTPNLIKNRIATADRKGNTRLRNTLIREAVAKGVDKSDLLDYVSMTKGSLNEIIRKGKPATSDAA